MVCIINGRGAATGKVQLLFPSIKIRFLGKQAETG
jgi:hypothetical protein